MQPSKALKIDLFMKMSIGRFVSMDLYELLVSQSAYISLVHTSTRPEISFQKTPKIDQLHCVVHGLKKYFQKSMVGFHAGSLYLGVCNTQNPWNTLNCPVVKTVRDKSRGLGNRRQAKELWTHIEESVLYRLHPWPRY